jgi:hypothetical protein
MNSNEAESLITSKRASNTAQTEKTLFNVCPLLNNLPLISMEDTWLARPARIEHSTKLMFYVGNILPDSTAAPALQGHQRELERHMRANSLEKQLQNRPKAEELMQKGILESE